MNKERIAGLLRQLQQNKLSRRSFIRSAMLLGVSLGAAEALAACAGSPAAVEVPPAVTHEGSRTVLGPAPTDTREFAPWDLLGVEATPVVDPAAYPTGTPHPMAAPLTPTPVLWPATTWSCPVCLQQSRPWL